METVLEILKYTIPSIITLIATYLVISKFLETQVTRKQIELFKETQGTTIPLRLQAYERLALFVERINPRNLIPRVYESNMNVAVLQHIMVHAIKEEFDHNLSQQIYVSNKVWDTVRGVKEQEINMITTIAKQLNPEAPAKELHQRIVDAILTDEQALPTEVALQIINEEAKRVLTHGPQA